MSNTRRNTQRRSATQKPEEGFTSGGFTTGATVAGSAAVPIFISMLTVTFDLPLPLTIISNGFFLAVFIVVQSHLVEARAIEREKAFDKAWRKRFHALQKTCDEIDKAVRVNTAGRLLDEVDDQRAALRSVPDTSHGIREQ